MYLLVIVLAPTPASRGCVSFLLVQSNKFLADFLVISVQSCFWHFTEQYETRLQAVHRLKFDDMSQQ